MHINHRKDGTKHGSVHETWFRHQNVVPYMKCGSVHEPWFRRKVVPYMCWGGPEGRARRASLRRTARRAVVNLLAPAHNKTLAAYHLGPYGRKSLGTYEFPMGVNIWRGQPCNLAWQEVHGSVDGCPVNSNASIGIETQRRTSRGKEVCV